MERFVVARAAEIPPGGRKLVSVRGRDVVVFNVKGEYLRAARPLPAPGRQPVPRQARRAWSNPTSPGATAITAQGEIIRCPWHGWEFDLRTGKSWCDPGRTWVKSYPSSVAAGRPRWSRGRTWPRPSRSAVEDDYVVIEA